MDGSVVLNVNRMLTAALAPELEKRGFSVLTNPELGSVTTYVEVIQCHGSDVAGWVQLKKNDDLNRVGYVAILGQPDLELYRRAYHLGAAVILDDTDPSIAADIIVARAMGEIRIPAGLLAALLGQDRRQLTAAERLVFRQLLDGRTLAQVAENTHYSERHVRRILSTVLAKAGTRSRTEAADFFSGELADGPLD